MPPFFEFFTTIISFYDICYLHLNPNFILMMSIFSYLCENFIGVESCLDIFRFFYTCQLMTRLAIRSYGFRLRDDIMVSYIDVGLKLSQWGWREEWFYLVVDNSLDNLQVPSTLVKVMDNWGSSSTTTLKLLTPAKWVG